MWNKSRTWTPCNSVHPESILQAIVRPSCWQLNFGGNWFIKQHNVPKHSSKSTSDWLKHKRIKVLEQTSQSLDINWNALIRLCLNECQKKTLNKLKKQCCEEKRAKILPSQWFDRLIVCWRLYLPNAKLQSDDFVLSLLTWVTFDYWLNSGCNSNSGWKCNLSPGCLFHASHQNTDFCKHELHFQQMDDLLWDHVLALICVMFTSSHYTIHHAPIWHAFHCTVWHRLKTRCYCVSSVSLHDCLTIMLIRAYPNPTCAMKQCTL